MKDVGKIGQKENWRHRERADFQEEAWSIDSKVVGGIIQGTGQSEVWTKAQRLEYTEL